jgi:hypothetical protein
MLTRVIPRNKPVAFCVPTIKPRQKPRPPAPVPVADVPKRKRLLRRAAPPMFGLLLRLWKWLTREDFYHDLMTNVLGSGLALFIGYLYAIGAGYVASPTGAETVRGAWKVVFNVLLFLLTGVAMRFVFFYDPDRHKHRPRWQRWSIGTLAFLMFVFLAMVIWDMMTYQLNFWPFNTWRFEYGPK